VTAYICQEKISEGLQETGTVTASLDYGSVAPNVAVVLTPDATASYVVGHGEWATRPQSLIGRPGKPQIYKGFTAADDNSGSASANAFSYVYGEFCTIHKNGTLTNGTVPCLVSRFVRVNPQASANLTSSGSLRIIELNEDLELTSAPTRISDTGPAHEISMFPMSLGWTYAVQLDSSGKIDELVPVPECGAVAYGLAGKFQTLAGVKNGQYNCLATAISWPDGVRRMAARCVFDHFSSQTPAAWSGRLYWRDAGSYNYHVDAQPGSGDTYEWPGGYTATTWQPIEASPRGIMRGVYPDEIGLFLPTGGSLAAPGGGGWNVLADFSGSDSGWETASMGGTLPAVGQEILICGGSDFYDAIADDYLPLRFAIWPEPAVSPVPIPVARGGVV
jgi:hypothetical protein